jgi:hypothetical protein
LPGPTEIAVSGSNVFVANVNVVRDGDIARSSIDESAARSFWCPGGER